MAKVVLFQGDSITDAGRRREDPYSLGYGYAHLAAATLGADRPGDFVFINRGVGGDLLADLYRRRQEDLLDLRPDYLSLFIGIAVVALPAGIVTAEYMNALKEDDKE